MWQVYQLRSSPRSIERLLRGVIQSSEPWVSSNEIRAGERWSDAISGELQKCNFGIICLTPSNQNSPWINFEAGAISKNLDEANVVPYLHGLTIPNMSGGPLSQFQAKESTLEGTTDLVKAINSQASTPLREDVLVEAITAYWPRFKAALDAIEMTPQDEKMSQRSLEDKVDELIQMFRSKGDNDTLINNLSRDTRFIITLLKRNSVSKPEEIKSDLIKHVSMQLRAFLKGADIIVDSVLKVIRVIYTDRTAFHYTQALKKESEIEQAVRTVTGGMYSLSLEGPQEVYNRHMSSLFGDSGETDEDTDEDILF